MRPPLLFFVAGNPAGQPRIKARFTGKFTQIYTPSTIVKDGFRREHPATTWKEQIRDAAREQIKSALVWVQWSGPLRVDLTFYLPRPKSHFRSNGELKPTAPKWHTAKPDRDNCDKLVLDTLTNLGFWADDKQVCDGRIRKLYAPFPANPHAPTGCLIEIKECD